MNVVVVTGVLSRPPAVRHLPSGSVVATLELTSRDREGTTSVPVVVREPTVTVLSLEAGAELVVTGRVQRRFFRAGGSTQSRTEVLARQVVRAHHTLRVRRAIAEARDQLASVPGVEQPRLG